MKKNQRQTNEPELVYPPTGIDNAKVQRTYTDWVHLPLDCDPAREAEKDARDVEESMGIDELIDIENEDDLLNTRIRTTFTFSSNAKANKFVLWLKRHRDDFNYGSPRYIDIRDVGHMQWCVEYEYSHELPRGVAIGIEL